MASELGRAAPESSLPTTHILRSALRAARLVGDGAKVEQLRLSYSRVPYDGIYRSEHLIAGEMVLRDGGLLREQDGILSPADGLEDLAMASERDGCEGLIVALLLRRPPLWLFAATAGAGGISWELIPDAERAVLESALDPASRELLLLALGRRFSGERQEETGEIAERHVLQKCKEELVAAGRADLAVRVRHVSLESDQLGYDITAPRLDGSTRRIECKGTRSSGELLTVHLSRNEVERGRVDRDWFLVACRVDAADVASVEGWCTAASLERLLPVDQDESARWSSVEIKLAASLLEAGLPPRA